MLTQLKGKLGDAPASDAGKLAEVIDDLSTGTDMQASDVIDVGGLKGLDRVMASIYNMRGQLIEKKARDLGVSRGCLATDRRRRGPPPERSYAEHQPDPPPLEGWLDVLDATHPPLDQFRGVYETSFSHVAAGIMKVESGGATFKESTDKPVVRFENHEFWKEWSKAGVRHMPRISTTTSISIGRKEASRGKATVSGMILPIHGRTAISMVKNTSGRLWNSQPP